MKAARFVTRLLPPLHFRQAATFLPNLIWKFPCTDLVCVSTWFRTRRWSQWPLAAEGLLCLTTPCKNHLPVSFENDTPTEMISDASNFTHDMVTKYFFLLHDFFSCNNKFFLTARRKLLCQAKKKILWKGKIVLLRFQEKNHGIKKHFCEWVDFNGQMLVSKLIFSWILQHSYF